MTRTSHVKNQKPPGKCFLHDVPYHFLNIPKNSARFGKIFHFETPHLKHCLCCFLTRISLLKQYQLKFSPNLACGTQSDFGNTAQGTSARIICENTT